MSISKENTALVIPNAIQIVVKADPSLAMTTNLKSPSQSVSSIASSSLLLSSNTVATAVLGVSTNASISKFNNNNNNHDNDDNENIINNNIINIANSNSKEQNEQKYFFTSFTQRDKTFALMETIWKRSNRCCPLSKEEIENTIHKLYGDNLGFETDTDKHLFFNNFDELEQSVNKFNMDTTNSIKTKPNGNNITENFKNENISENFNNSSPSSSLPSTLIEKLDNKDNNNNSKNSGADAQEITIPSSEINIIKKNDMVQSNNISKSSAMTFTTNTGTSSNTLIGKFF